ncbi:MAG: hypothetical protein J6U54_08010 [Clostridiales bacterium]|nr:hypothetical protein [Clostridiales bacterium]
MPIEGNSHKAKEIGKTERTLKPVVDSSTEKSKPGFLEKWLKDDGKTIKDFFIESIVLPGILDSISGIGEIIIDGFTDGISALFEKNGFETTGSRGRSSHTDYTKSSKRRSRRDRDYDDDDYDDSIRYDNVRVKNEREARRVIEELKALVADRDYGYATVANLYELTGNKDYVTHPDHNHGWTKLDHNTSDYYVYTKHREKPYLLRLPVPKDISPFL